MNSVVPKISNLVVVGLALVVFNRIINLSRRIN